MKALNRDYWQTGKHKELKNEKRRISFKGASSPMFSCKKCEKQFRNPAARKLHQEKCNVE